MQRSDLPFGSEFSPSQVDLVRVLELAQEHGGDWRAFERAIREEYFEKHATSEYNKGKLANNTKLSMIAYGIIGRDANLTDLGNRLLSLRHDKDRLYSELARHILTNLGGAMLVQCIRDMELAGEVVTLNSLRQRLEERGVSVPRGARHPSSMRLWLERAGVFRRRWEVDESRFSQVMGIGTQDLEVLSRLPREQRDYLRALANLEGNGPFKSNEIEKLATTTYGTKFDEKSLPKTVLYPLRDCGYITLERGTKEPGRGAKPFLVRPTQQLNRDLIEPLTRQIEKQIPADLWEIRRQPLAEVLDKMRSEDKHTRGLALEALALKLMHIIDLKYVATRRRGYETGGAEVDLIFESDRLVFSRWQVQCKNVKGGIVLDDVAKEVGLAPLLKSNVIVMVSAGGISRDARDYVNRIMQVSNLSIVVVEGGDLKLITENPVEIVEVFNRQARHAMRIKAVERQEEEAGRCP